MLKHHIIHPDLVVAAGFSYQVITAHNGCLQLEVTVQGRAAHAAFPESGVDALQGALPILQALYAENARYRQVRSTIPGIGHPSLNVGLIAGGTNTNVVPGCVRFKLDRRMIPEEDPVQVESDLRQVIASAAVPCDGIHVEVRRILLAKAMKTLPGAQSLVETIQKHGKMVLGETIVAMGTPLYTDARLFCEAGIPGIIYGAGPRTVLESHAKQSDERLDLEDLRRATKVIARTLKDLLNEHSPPAC